MRKIIAVLAFAPLLGACSPQTQARLAGAASQAQQAYSGLRQTAHAVTDTVAHAASGAQQAWDAARGITQGNGQ